MRTAAGVIVAATLVVVVGGGALFRLLDHEEYQTIWTGMWFALQTVTTVGYGDVTPKNPSGKIVAALIMLEGVAFLAIVTAAITSTFVTRAARERLATVEGGETDDASRIEARFHDPRCRWRVLDRPPPRDRGRVPAVREGDRARQLGRAGAAGRGLPRRGRRRARAGSLVFHKTNGPVDLRGFRNWCDWTPRADWRRPEGPDSNVGAGSSTP
jgi:hypothetical protein